MATYRRRVYRGRRRVNRGPKLHPLKRYVKKDRSNLKWGRIVKDVAMLKGLINTEVKYIDRFGQNTATDNFYIVGPSNIKAQEGNTTVAPIIGYLSNNMPYMDQGDDFNQRNGRSVKLKSLQVKGTLAMQLDASPTDSEYPLWSGQYRVMIIVDHQAQQGEMTDLVPILFQQDQNGEYSMNSRVNRQQNKRYSVIASRKIQLGENYPKKDFNIYVRLNDKIKFNGTLASNFMDKAFHIVVFGGASWVVAGTQSIQNFAALQYETRYTYVDN